MVGYFILPHDRRVGVIVDGNGIVGVKSPNKHTDFLGVTVTQYDALMQRIGQLQSAFDRLLEKEPEKIKFMAEVNLRLQAVEKQLAEHASDVKEQAEISEGFRHKVQGDLFQLKEQIATRLQTVEALPNQMKWQYEGATKLASTVAVGLAAIWGVVQAIYWVYEKLVSK